MRRRRPLLALAASTAILAACSSGGTTPSATSLGGEITVAAAASLTEPFTELGTAFETEHPGTTITFTFDSSSTLSQQVLDGAPVDVFASADADDLAELTDQDLTSGPPMVFARNRLAIVTKPGDPEGIESLEDLAGAGVISLCGEAAPCGRFAAEVLARAGVTLRESSVTRGQNATATLTAVSEGDAVAGIVYATDALAAGDAVEAVEIPADDNVVAAYPLAVLSDRGNTALADAFAAYVSSDAGQAILGEHGFLPPT